MSEKTDAAREILAASDYLAIMDHVDHARGVAPSVAVSMASHDVEEAREFAAELVEVIAHHFPAWRGWGIEYPWRP